MSARGPKEHFAEASRHRPCPLGRVRNHRVGDLRSRIVDGPERYPGVVPLQHHRASGSGKPEPEAVPHRGRSPFAVRPNHLGNAGSRDDPTVDLSALLAETGLHPGTLKDMVASPGGTTIAGIAALEEGGVRTTFIRAVERATLRSRELGRGPA